MKINNYKNIIVRFAKIFISTIIIYFIIQYIIINVRAINNFEIIFNYRYLLTSFFILVFFIINQSFLWYYITLKNKCNLELKESLIYRIYSEFGKYIPGKIFGYSLLLYVYTKANHSKILVTMSMYYEFIANVLASTIIFFVSLLFVEIQYFQKYRTVTLILLLLLFTLIHPKILNYLVSSLLNLFKREPIKLNIFFHQLIIIITLYLINIIIFGFAFIFFIKSFYPISFSNFLFITGTTAAAGLIGIFAVFVPAGLGIREGIMIFALSLIIPPTFAGIIALSSRIWLTLGEVIIFGFIFIFSKFYNSIYNPTKIIKEDVGKRF